MSRPLLPLAVLITVPFAAFAQDRTDPVERAIVVQRAMAAAQDYLNANMPAEAVAVLEPQLSNADGHPGFLPLLRRAYTGEVKRLETAPKPDAARVAEVRRRLDLLQPPAAAPQAADGAELLRDARALFKQAKYAEAAAKFAAAVAARAAIDQNEVAAWAYCRVRLAADAVNDPKCDAETATAAAKDVTEALTLAPGNADLQKVGQSVLVLARQKANGRREPAGAAPPSPAIPADWEAVETASFRVRFQGSRELADVVAKAAEERRAELFKRWSGPATTAWQPQCEIVLHPTAECYTRMTKRPAGETGSATVRLADGRVTERRIELRADDACAVANTLPRELTHIILADLFPDRPPPKWAEEGMAVLAGSPEEVSRYVRTLPRCARDNELVPVAALLEMKDFPAVEKVTGFYCESVSVVDYLVKLRGEQNFTIFLRDCQRYGTASALKRNYSIDNPQALEAAWKRAALSAGP